MRDFRSGCNRASWSSDIGEVDYRRDFGRKFDGAVWVSENGGHRIIVVCIEVKVRHVLRGRRRGYIRDSFADCRVYRLSDDSLRNVLLAAFQSREDFETV